RGAGAQGFPHLRAGRPRAAREAVHEDRLARAGGHLMSSFKLKKQDQVKVISGKNKGKTGRVIKVIADENRVVVEGLNKVKKHQKPTRQDQKGGIVEKEMSLHASNVMLIGKSGEPVKVKKSVQNGKRVRLEQKSGKAVD